MIFSFTQYQLGNFAYVSLIIMVYPLQFDDKAPKSVFETAYANGAVPCRYLNSLMSC